jgi:G3E family GTPase
MPVSQIVAVAGAPGSGKTTWIKQQIAQGNAQGLVPAVFFCPGAGTVPIDLTCMATEFPHIQILLEGQELQLIEQIDNGATAFIELGFHLDLRSGIMLLDGLSEHRTLQRVAFVPSGLEASEWHDWADEVHASEHGFDLNGLQVWRSPLTGQVLDPASLNVFWYELTHAAYGEVCRCKGIFDLPDGRAFYIDFVEGMADSTYVPLNLPRWLTGRPERFSGIELVGRGFDSQAIAQSITDSCLSEQIIDQYQQQIKQSLLVSA